MRILAIETSCDETAVSILEAEGGLAAPKFKILSHIVASQIELHAKWGGVVPNLAKREHELALIPSLDQALTEAGLKKETKNILNSDTKDQVQTFLTREQELLNLFTPFIEKIEIPEIDLIAVTSGPGLEPALWVGINFARALSLAWQKPLLPINHMEGHVVSPLLEDGAQVDFPALALLISGGHTELVLINEWLDYKVIGQTRDDAVGEAFDKVARLLGLPYPGGPGVSKLAAAQRESDRAPRWQLPRPMLHSGDLDFSFSGIKTAVLYLIKKIEPLDHEAKEDLAREFEDAVIEVLIKKTLKAIEEHNIKSLIIGGGVIANTTLQTEFAKALAERYPNIRLLIPEFKLATDNATMIGMAAYLHAQQESGQIAPKIIAEGNLAL